MKVARRTLPLLFVVWLVLMLAAIAHADPAEPSVRLNEQIEQKIENAVAYVSVEYQRPDATRQSIESGSGFFVAPNLLVTNHHVIAEALKASAYVVKVRLFSGCSNSRFYFAEIVRSDPRADLALLSVKGDLPAIEPLQLHPDLPGKQTEVFAFGFPLGTMLDRSVNGPNVCLRRGYVSRLINDGANIEADLNIDKGISGGPLVDQEGVVRGVIRAMAGSDFNKSYAGIAVSSPLLIAFCANNGYRITLRGGQVVEPGAQVTMPTATSMEPAPRPRAVYTDDVLHAFFSIGSALRLSSLVPRILQNETEVYTVDVRQCSKSNADLVRQYLKKVEAPAPLVQRANELFKLLGQSEIKPNIIGEKAAVLEEACDEWAQQADRAEKLNYDFGAWLTELSLGLLDVKSGKDLCSCEYFLNEVIAQNATPEMIDLLTRLHADLEQYKRDKSDEVRRAINKEADRLIGIGYIPTVPSGNNRIKPLDESPSFSPNNRLSLVP